MRVSYRSVQGTIGGMVRRLTVTLPAEAAELLGELARAERRDPRDQAAIILERALVRRDRPGVKPSLEELHESPRRAAG